MAGYGTFKSISTKIKNLIVAAAFVVTQLIVPLSLSGTAAAAGAITFGSQFENQVFPDNPNTWATGQLDNYSEGDYVNFRFQLNATDSTSAGTMQIEYDLGSCAFFTNYFNFVSTTPSIATVTPGANTLNGSGNGKYYAQKLNVNFSSAGTTTVIFTLQLSNTAGECSGSNTGVRLNVPNSGSGDFGNVGAKTLPMAANQVLENPSLTITKTVASGEANPDDFYFTISPAINGIVNGVSDTWSEVHLTDGSVTINEVNPDGQFVITEHGPDGYAFQGGTGTNCSVTNATTGVMTATVTADNDNPVDAICNFTNTRAMGSLKVVKDVVNDNGGTKTYADFSFTVDGQNYNFDETTSPDGAKTLSLPTGSYTVSEPEENTMGYATSYDNCKNVMVVAGQTTTCTITNDDHAPSLTLNKFVVNDNGGTAAASAWTLTATGSLQDPTNLSGPGVDNSTTDITSGTNFKADTYTLAETGGPTGYAASEWDCTNGVTVNENDQITLSNGQATVCTITNNDIAPTLTLRKIVSNPYGGSGVATADLWTLRAQHEQDNPLINMTGSLNNDDSASTTSKVAMAGIAYDLSESGPAGYNASSWSCTVGGTITNGDQVTLSLGEDVTCSITNTQLPASVSGHKYEVDAQGDGTAPVANWTVYLLVSGNPIASTATDANGYYEFTGLAWGDYDLAECLNVNDGCDTWTQIYSPPATTVNGDDLTSDNNDFGNFQNGSINGYKFNDLNGDGVKQENEPKLANWPFSYVFDANGDDVFNESAVDFSTDQNGDFTLPNVAPGKYQICEDPQTELGWVRTAPASSDCRTRTISSSDQTVTGVIFGNQARGTLTVVKNVDDGFGNVTQNTTGWTWDYDGTYQDGSNETASSGNTVTAPADSYMLSEDQKDNYHFTSVSCTNNGDAFVVDQDESTSVQISAGDNVVCTFTNTRDTGYLKVVKDVVNDNSGDKTYANFHFTVNNGDSQGFNETSSPDGEKLVKVLTGAPYSVAEPEADTMGYTTSYGNCTNLEVTANNNIDNPVVCTITNNDVAHPGIHIVKDGPTVAHEGDTLTYTATITNTGDAPLDVIGVEDNVAGTVTIEYANGYPVGDTNQNSLLDIDETWTGTVDYTVPEDQVDDIVNIMTVCADDATGRDEVRLALFSELADGELTGDVCDDDSHTTDVLHPAINVVKSGKPSAPAGATVTYTFTVTNTGDTPVAVNSVIDTIAGDGVYQSGDTNQNSLLDLDETWVYTADYKIPGNQITNVNNTVTVCASDQLEKQVCDSDSHSLTIPKVLGTSTELPNTGQNQLLAIMAGIGFILMAVAVRWLGRKPQSTVL